VFATGTPISNTLAEMYTVLRYLAPSLLHSTGTSHFDAWAANFAEAVTALEMAPDGSGYRMNTRFARFINMPELLSRSAQLPISRQRICSNCPGPNSKPAARL
jgi:N12 class adenine-specific DNA methylase